MRIRDLALAAAAAGVVATGCGTEDCPAEPADVVSVPTCSVRAGVPVTVQFPVCTRCNQTAPTCQVDLSQVGTGYVQFDPVTQACDPGNSCPLPSCGVGGADREVVTCSFTAPAAGDYSLVVYDAGSGTDITVPFSTRGSATTCGST
jgi:hypothetical protein